MHTSWTEHADGHMGDKGGVKRTSRCQKKVIKLRNKCLAAERERQKKDETF